MAPARTRTTRIRTIGALAAAVAVTLAACGRSDDGTEVAGQQVESTTTVAGETTEPDEDPVTGPLGRGEFGDLGTVCGPGDGETEPVQGVPGVDGTTINVAVFHDAGFEGRPGLNKEFQDLGQAFTAWCNEQGGIRGYELAMSDRDVALTKHQQRMVESCEQDFAMVGGGSTIDDPGQPTRLECGLPDFAGFVVTPTAARADLIAQPVPNPVEQLPIGHLGWLEEQFPEAVDHVGLLVGDFGTTKLQGERWREAVEQAGWTVVAEEVYPIQGVDDWSGYVATLRDAGVRGLIWSGEPENLAAFSRAAADAGVEFDFVNTETNHYDDRFIDAGGDAVDDTFIRSSFFPFERADENPATAQYLHLVEAYDDDGKVALLGAQGLSAWLLFSTALGECIDAGDLSRDCVYATARDVDTWTGGGIHAPTDPGDGGATECYLILEATGDGFVEVDIETTDGPYRCPGPEGILELESDFSAYGEPARCPSGIDDPLPSECAS